MLSSAKDFWPRYSKKCRSETFFPKDEKTFSDDINNSLIENYSMTDMFSDEDTVDRYNEPSL